MSTEPEASQATSSVRFGLIRAGPGLRRWEAECLDQLVALPSVELAVVIVLAQADLSGSAVSVQGWPLRLLTRIAQRGAWAPADATKYLSGVPELRCRVAPQGPGQAIVPEDLAPLRERRLDFLLTFGPGRWSGGVLEAARWGLWAVRYPGQPGSADAPPGFWEMCREETVTGAALVALSDDPAGDTILKQGFVRTAGGSYADAAEICFEAARWPAQACRRLQVSQAAVGSGRRLRVGEPDPPPQVRDLLRAVRAMARYRWREFARKNVYADLWNVGVVRAPIEAFLEPGFRPAVQWIAAPPLGTFRADPFGLMRHGRLTVLCEEFEFRKDRARIVALDLPDPVDQGHVQVAMAPPFHVSYPYLIEREGEVLCVPETHQAGEVALYRAEDFPTRWTKVATLLSGVPALDATVFRHGERWWLTCTMQGPTERSHLYLYHAPDLFGPWTPHLGNPVKTDIRSARPGGTPFVHQGVLYRPAQDSSRTYGGGVVINRVTALTPYEFEEEPAAVVGPLPESPYPDGLHTLSAADGITLIDGKRVLPITSGIGLGGLRPWPRR